MPIQMIVTDLDRTLLRTDKSISEYTVQVLKRCQRQGILIAFASARSECTMARIAGRIAPDVMISSGGALARRGEQLLYRRILEKNLANSLLRRCLNELGLGYLTADTENGYVVNRPFDPDDPSWRDFAHGKVIDVTKGFDCGVFKLTAQLSDKNAAAQIAQAFDNINVLGYAGEDWYQFAHKDASKWKAARMAAKQLGIPIANITAFGDDRNDIELLRSCGTGVAVANALEEAKAAADFVCGSNDEDGVAKWLEAHVLCKCA